MYKIMKYLRAINFIFWLILFFLAAQYIGVLLDFTFGSLLLALSLGAASGLTVIVVGEELDKH